MNWEEISVIKKLSADPKLGGEELIRLVYIERCASFVISFQDQKDLFDLCKNINEDFEKTNSGHKVKFIVELGELDDSLMLDFPKLIR